METEAVGGRTQQEGEGEWDEWRGATWVGGKGVGAA